MKDFVPINKHKSDVLKETRGRQRRLCEFIVLEENIHLLDSSFVSRQQHQ